MRNPVSLTSQSSNIDTTTAMLLSAIIRRSRPPIERQEKAGCGRLNAASEWQVRWIPDAHPITVRLFELPTHTFSSSRAKVQMSRPSSGA